MEEKSQLRNASKIVFSVFISIILAYFVYFLPLPVYVLQPGLAASARAMVEMENNGEESKGQFLLTTVSVRGASLFSYARAVISDLQEVRWKGELLQPNETEDDFAERQHAVMLSSQSDAVQAAYAYAGVPYRIITEGIIVLEVRDDGPLNNVLKAGDYIVNVDGEAVSADSELRAALALKQPGESVKLQYMRNGQRQEAVLELRAGTRLDAQLGAVIAEVQAVRADHSSQQAVIEAGEIGGPSAGFIFALEMIDRLLAADLTRGYVIAGTGTIDPHGNIGAIGGIQHKVSAAANAGAELFFAPKDGIGGVRNSSDAAHRADKIGTSMQIVPVSTLDEAIRYLDSLPAKERLTAPAA